MHLPGFTQGSMMLYMVIVPVHLAMAVVANGKRSAA
jgi:hypothetical protein